MLSVTTKSGIYNGYKVIGTQTLGLRGLVLWLKFNEGSGNIAYDSSFYNNHGTIYGAVYTDGKFGKALSFDGVDDYVEVPHSPELTWSTEDFTVELWLYFIGRSANFASIISKQTWGSSGWGISSEQNNHGFAFLNGGKSEKYCTKTTTSALKNKWVHMAFVRKGSNWTWYINGVVDNSGTLTEFVEGTEPLQIMGEPAIPRYCEGTIDEVRIYNRALSEEEIIMLYYNRIGAVPSKAI